MDHNTDHVAAISKLGAMIKDMRIAMLTTADEHGALHSRPMATQETEFDGTLWFFSRRNTPRNEQVQQDHNVNLAYSNPDDKIYVSVTGTAAEVNDRAKMEELWKPFLKTWFPKGLEDPELTLLKVTVQQAQYWDDSAGMMSVVAGFIKATVTGTPAKTGDSATIDFEKTV